MSKTGVLAGQTALITGGAKGAGAASVRAFLAEGCRVVFADRDQEAGEGLVRDCAARNLDPFFIHGDVSVSADVERIVSDAFDHLGKIDILFNHAGVIICSTKWFAAVLSTPRWLNAVWNSLIVAAGTVVIATPLGTLAALGLDRIRFPGKALLMALLISPMIVPIIITAVGVYFFFAPLGLANSLLGLILAHSAIAVPFVLVTVAASISQLDRSLPRAASSLGAPPFSVFGRVTLPLILPGIVSGTIFAFATSFDEVVIAMMITGPSQRTLPRELLSGARENLDPTVLAVASIIIAVSAGLLMLVTLVRRSPRENA